MNGEQFRLCVNPGGRRPFSILTISSTSATACHHTHYIPHRRATSQHRACNGCGYEPERSFLNSRLLARSVPGQWVCPTCCRPITTNQDDKRDKMRGGHTKVCSRFLYFHYTDPDYDSIRAQRDIRDAFSPRGVITRTRQGRAYLVRSHFLFLLSYLLILITTDDVTQFGVPTGIEHGHPWAIADVSVCLISLLCSAQIINTHSVLPIRYSCCPTSCKCFPWHQVEVECQTVNEVLARCAHNSG
jgi:hypothetical protein